MGLLDELLAQAVPNQQAPSGPNPLAAALQTLLVGAPSQAVTQPAAAPNASGIPDGGLVGGLGGLLQKLQDAGHGQAVQSWTTPGPNQQIAPHHLGAAIGPQNVTVAAQQSGLDEQELLQHLAQNLPQIVSTLTANGTRMPSLAEVAAALTQQQ
jgi:uncharacterized protein YidB (DUF937 family)